MLKYHINKRIVEIKKNHFFYKYYFIIKYIMTNHFIVFNTGDRVQDRRNRKIGTIDNNNTLKLRKIRSLLVKFDDGSKKIYVDSEDKQLLHYPNDYFDKTVGIDERFT